MSKYIKLRNKTSLFSLENKTSLFSIENKTFFLIFFIALSLRLLAASNKTFWLDEAFSWSVAKQNLGNLLLGTAADNNPPFYYLFLHFWLKLNQSEIFLRFPSLVFGLISIFLIYLIGKKLINKRVGIISAILISLSPLHVYFSAETRMYSLWTLEILTSFYFFLKILEKPKRIIYPLCLFFISSLLALYTHYYTLFFILTLDLFLILKRKIYPKQFLNLLIIQLLIGLLFLPWTLIFLSNTHPQPWGSPFLNLPATFASFTLGGMGAVTLKSFFAVAVPLPFKIIFSSLITFSAIIFLKGFTDQKKNKSLLPLIIFFPLLLAEGVSFIKPIYSPRPFIAFSFAFYLLLANGLESFKKQFKSWPKILIFALLIFTLIIQNFYPPFKPQTLKEAADFIKKSSPSSIIVHTDILTFYPFQYYFRGDKVNQFLIFPSGLTSKTTDFIGGSPTILSEIIKREQPFWSVTYTWDEKTWKFKREQSGLKGNFGCSLIKTIDDLEINYCQLK